MQLWQLEITLAHGVLAITCVLLTERAWKSLAEASSGGGLVYNPRLNFSLTLTI